MNKRANWLLALITFAVVILAVLASVFSGGNAPAKFDPASPEAAVQGYTRAVLEGDWPAAAALLAPELECTESDLDSSSYPHSTSVVLLHSLVSGERAHVTVDITEYGEAPLDGYSYEETLDLRRGGGQWLITGTPWPHYGCGEGTW